MSDELENEYRRLAYEAIMTVGMLKADRQPVCTALVHPYKRVVEEELKSWKGKTHQLPLS
jgi:hypothetical protein